MTRSNKTKTVSLLPICCVFLFLGAALITQSGQADDRALLIGVGKYRDPRIPQLAGIDLDIAMMKENAALMGFKESNIKILMDEEATLSNVTSVFDTWLINGVSPEDRVLIFFSSHGTNVLDENGDESDGQDEALVLNDSAIENRNGKSTVVRALVDDQFGTMLGKIPSSDILVLIDACHSGTATKSWVQGGVLGSVEVQSKFFKYAGMPAATKGSFRVATKTSKTNFVAVAAAGDGEEAIATTKGSLFTLSVSKLIKKASIESIPISPSQIKKATAEMIRQRKQESKPNFALFQPVLSGNQSLAKKPLRLRKVSNKNRPAKWKQLEAIADKAEILNVSANQGNYHIGDYLEMKIKVDKPGYLNVINIGPDDDITILFPNEGHPDSQVREGIISIPTDKMKSKGFVLKTGEPLGDNIIVATLSAKPVNAFQSGSGKGVFRGLSDLGLTELKAATPTRGSFSVASEKSQDWFKAGKIITLVCRSASDC